MTPYTPERGWEPCSLCDGTGELLGLDIEDYEMAHCHRCGGAGEIELASLSYHERRARRDDALATQADAAWKERE